jgi:hypothetical protein
MVSATPLHDDPTRRSVTESEIDAEIERFAAEQHPGNMAERDRLIQDAWMRGMVRIDLETPPPTEEHRRRSELMSRIAMLADVAPGAVDVEALFVRDAAGRTRWRDPIEVLEARVTAWEALAAAAG